MSKKITGEMLTDEGIRSALELLREQVSRFEDENKKKQYITGEGSTGHLLPLFYIKRFKTVAKRLQTRQYNVWLAAIALMTSLPYAAQEKLVRNADKQFRLLRDSTPETLDIQMLESLMQEFTVFAGSVDNVLSRNNKR